MLDAVLARFVAHCPVAVMAHLVLRRALEPDWVNAVFEAHAEQQYTRDLLFSTVVDLMGLVAVGLRPSLHAAAQEARAAGTLHVSLQALYAKVNHTEPAVLRALVREAGARLGPVVAALRASAPAAPSAAAPWPAGYRVRVLDGNHLPATEKRVAPLRGTRGAALPGQALVLYDPVDDLVVDYCASEDAHAQEPSYVAPLVATAAANELWVADRNFATRGILHALSARGAVVLMREHGNHPHPVPVGERRCLGRGASGVVYEQAVDCPPPTTRPGAPLLRLRRVEVALDTPLESGEVVLRLLTTLPAAVADAAQVAALYRQRWTIEGLFQRLEGVLHSEVHSLGQPRAALLAFGVALVAYNVLAVVGTTLAVEAAARAAGPARPAVPNADARAGGNLGAAVLPAPLPLSLYYVAHTVREHYRGLMIAVTAPVWARYDTHSPAALAAELRALAGRVRLEAYRKHPRGPGGPRPTPGYVAPRELQHVSTARLLNKQKAQRREQAP